MPKTRPNKEAEGFARRLRELLWMSKAQGRHGAGAYLQRKYGVSNVVANAWLNGEYRPEIPTAYKIARDHNSDFETLYFGERRYSAANDHDPEWADVLAYKQAVGLGNEREAEEYVQTHKIKFRRESLSKHNLSPSDLGTMRGDGDSMFPTIKHDDLVLFDKSDVRPRHRKVYALKVPGAAKDAYNVKRCKISKGVVSFVADNPNGDHGWVERRLDDPDFPIEIIGRVRWAAGWVD